MAKKNTKDTKEIVSKLKKMFIEFAETKGTLPFHCSVIKNSMNNPSKGSTKVYEGINALVTYIARILRGWDSDTFLTAHEINERGGLIRKGEHGVPIIKAIFFDYDENKNKLTWKQAKEKRLAGEKVYSKFVGWREWAVFNLAQTTLEYEHLAQIEDTDTGKNPSAEELLKLYNDAPKIVFDKSLPRNADGFYSPSLDEVHVLPCAGYETPSDYYFALFHELMHSTEHKNRLNIKGGAHGTKAYVRNELRAEMGAMIAVAHTDLPTDFKNSMAYVKGCTKKLTSIEDAEFGNLIATSFSMAQHGFEYMIGEYKPRETKEEAA